MVESHPTVYIATHLQLSSHIEEPNLEHRQKALELLRLLRAEFVKVTAVSHCLMSGLCTSLFSPYCLCVAWILPLPQFANWQTYIRPNVHALVEQVAVLAAFPAFLTLHSLGAWRSAAARGAYCRPQILRRRM